MIRQLLLIVQAVAAELELEIFLHIIIKPAVLELESHGQVNVSTGIIYFFVAE